MAKPDTQRASKRQPWFDAPYEAQDARSMQALALYAKGAERPWPPGEEPPPPTPYDVKRVLDWIVHQAAQTYVNPAQLAFAGNDQNLVWFIAGRASVGKQIVKLMMIKPSALEKNPLRNEEGIGPEPQAMGEAREI